MAAESNRAISENGCQMARLRRTSEMVRGRSMSRMHPGISDRVVILMIATQLKGLGGRRNKQCRPVAAGLLYIADAQIDSNQWLRFACRSAMNIVTVQAGEYKNDPLHISTTYIVVGRQHLEI